MFALSLILVFLSAALFVLAFSPLARDERQILRIQDFGKAPSDQFGRLAGKKDGLSVLKGLAVFNRPLISPDMRRSMMDNITVSQVNMTPEEFLLFKQVTIAAMLLVVPGFFTGQTVVFGILMAVLLGYSLPDIWLKSKVRKIKEEIVRYLPDTVDLLGLCVNAGLDFMMALKWVSEKSSANAVVNEMNGLLQEISVGKPRRDALRDMARKYNLPDLSTFSRTLIQADKMGTSVSEALNILSEDMRQARFRRGEAMALKAPIKLLLPLLFCIFPVVGILVGGPIVLDFMTNNPMKQMGM